MTTALYFRTQCYFAQLIKCGTVRLMSNVLVNSESHSSVADLFRVVTPGARIVYSHACRYHAFLHVPESASAPICNLSLKNYLLSYQKVCKHTKKPTKSLKKQESSDDDFSDDEELELEDEFNAEDKHFEEDEDFPPNYRDITAHVKNLRLDYVVGFGLGMNRSKVEDYFLASKIKLNGGRVLKKSVKLESGDYVDVITEHHDGVMNIKRVRIVDVKMKVDSTKATVYLRVWRAGAKVPVTKAKFARDS